VLATYRNQLREYRALQEELTPWTHAFQQRHGRKPRLADVEHTGMLAAIRLVMLPTDTAQWLALAMIWLGMAPAQSNCNSLKIPPRPALLLQLHMWQAGC
jgi:hypothetical protein